MTRLDGHVHLKLLNPLRAKVLTTPPVSVREHPGRAVRSDRTRLAKTSPAGPLHGPRRIMRRQAGRAPVQSRIYIGQCARCTARARPFSTSRRRPRRRTADGGARPGPARYRAAAASSYEIIRAMLDTVLSPGA